MVHEIKHDGYRLIVRRDGAAVRLYTRNAFDLTARLPAIAAAAERIKATSFTIDGEAVVLGPDGLSQFDELRRRAAAQTAILYAFDLIEHDGENQRAHRRGRSHRLCARLSAWRRGHRLKAGGWHLSFRSVPRLDQGPQPASIAVQRERSERWNS